MRRRRCLLPSFLLLFSLTSVNASPVDINTSDSPDGVPSPTTPNASGLGSQSVIAVPSSSTAVPSSDTYETLKIVTATSTTSTHTLGFTPFPTPSRLPVPGVFPETDPSDPPLVRFFCFPNKVD